jgi:16S rRNA (guanine527-N7)-methyltransferase
VTESLQQSIRKAHDWGFIGGDLDQHLKHSLAFADALKHLEMTSQSGVDLGSGGGLPSLVLLEQFPGLRLCLVEVMAKRAAFLRDAVNAMQVSERADVVVRRAEELAHDARYREQFSFVTARSFAGPGITAEVAAGYVALDGFVVVSEPPDSAGERWSAEGLAGVGLELVEIRRDTFGLAILRKFKHCGTRYPRLAGKAWKQPLF